MRNRMAFPEGGTSWENLSTELQDRKADDVDWKNGRVPLYVFFNDEDTLNVGREAFMTYFSENALGRKRAFQSVQSMEQEVLDYGLTLMSAPSQAEGVFTSGGSESILIAMKAARDSWRANAARGARPNIVAAVTVHPAFDKAADLMDFEIRRTAPRADGRADPEAFRGQIDAGTMAIVGSAPCFPHGVMDPIDALSDIASDTGTWLHVDACVGGWMAPFFTMNGRDTPHFDFRFAGVRSISADLHKFGFCPKPASTVFFRDAEDAARATFVADAWPNGRFETSTLVGTRPGGAVAGAWAVLNHLGIAGYREAARRLASMVDTYVAGIMEIDELEMVATPDLSIINFTSKTIDMALVAEGMSQRGWLVGMTREPVGLHAMMSLFHAPVVEEYLSHLRASVDAARTVKNRKSSMKATY